MYKIYTMSLRGTEKACHSLQRTTGMSSLHVAKQLKVLILLTSVLLVGTAVPERKWLLIAIWGFCVLLNALSLMDAHKVVETWERNPDRLPIEVLIQRTIHTYPQWIFLVGFVIFCAMLMPLVHEMFFALSTAYLIFMLLYSMVIHVNPLPPAPSKVREWLSGFGRTLVPAYSRSK